MIKKLFRYSLALLLAGSILQLPSIALAEQASQADNNSRVRRTASMRPQIYQKLDEVRALSDEGKYQQALDRLESIEKIRRNSYEQAMTWNMHAYVHFNREAYDKAIEAYKKVLDTKNLPLSLEQNTQYSLAKLHLMQEDYRSSLKALDAWFELVEQPGAEAHILKAQIYYQLEEFEKALPEVKKAVELQLSQGKQPRENWLLLERAVYYQNKNYEAMERCLKDLITWYPKAQYWVQLSAVYNELGKPEKELSALETAYDQSLLEKESQVVSLAQALLASQIPYKAAQTLLQGMKDGVVEESARNLSLLGDALMLAREYDQAIDVMGKAAEASGKGRDFYKLAQIHAERQEWPDSLANINKALQTGDSFDNKYDLLILKGLAQFNLDKLEASEKTFKEAKTFPEAEKMARQWLEFIDNEKKRKAYMASSK